MYEQQSGLSLQLAKFLENSMAAHEMRGQGFYVNFNRLKRELDDDAVLTMSVLLQAGFAQSTNTDGEWTTARGAGGKSDLFTAFPDGALVDILDTLEPV
ncbi:hypothetical protein [Sulfitobacter litoralis]|jgi:hypothetical protein|uniref:hypothetical protein n=1 Tax=Sulfitobacter litoralis TaxID=335975 RepID=UPI000B687A55|nr:MAG: hypothetical protein CBB97_17145 [Candidatus Endolissoclinum sp. TMED37]|tara:strand:- start:2035 stop:2331 length:297 start_codon:yes stop_codon:yes gene_type:complete